MFNVNSTPFLSLYPVSAHRGYNNDSGRVFKNCGKSQYMGPPEIDTTQPPVPMYKHDAAESRELVAMNDGVDVAKLTAGTQQEVPTRGLYIEGGGVDGLQVLMADNLDNMANAPAPEDTSDGLKTTDVQYRLEVPSKFAISSKGKK